MHVWLSSFFFLTPLFHCLTLITANYVGCMPKNCTWNTGPRAGLWNLCMWVKGIKMKPTLKILLPASYIWTFFQQCIAVYGRNPLLTILSYFLLRLIHINQGQSLFTTTHRMDLFPYLGLPQKGRGSKPWIMSKRPWRKNRASLRRRKLNYFFSLSKCTLISQVPFNRHTNFFVFAMLLGRPTAANWGFQKMLRSFLSPLYQNTIRDPPTSSFQKESLRFIEG